MFHDKEKALNEEIQQLKQEKKGLELRVQSVEVLGKVLQESQEENARLREDFTNLKQNLSESGLDVSQLSLASTPSMASTRCFLSQAKDHSLTTPIEGQSYDDFEMVPYMPSIIGSNQSKQDPENQKDLSQGVHRIKKHAENLLQVAKEMLSITPNIRNQKERQSIAKKIGQYCEKVSKRVHDVNTREKLLQGLKSQEEELKEKVHQMKNEQISQEKVIDSLEIELDNFTEELQGIQDEIKVFGDAEMIDKEELSLQSLFVDSKKSPPNVEKIDQDKQESAGSSSKPECERCFDLIKALNQSEQHKNEAIRQKEEILDVNHAWDAQYKKLNSEKSKEINELKQQVEFYKNPDNQRKYEAVRSSYKKVIDDERTMKEKALEEKMRNKEKIKQLEEELKRLSLELREQQSQHRYPSGVFSSYSTPLSSLAAQAGQSSDLVKEVEVLKQQLRIYIDDFNAERQDRERMQEEKQKLEDELKESKETIAALEEQVRVYKEDFNKETAEKDRLLRQLNREVSEPEIRYSGHMTRKAQAVAERQAKLRALQNEYVREERLLMQEQRDLQRAIPLTTEPQLYVQRYPSDRYMRQYEPLRQRGSRPSDEMFYGGDVQADTRGIGREVPDSVTRTDLTCPRCHRLFAPHELDEFTTHTSRCIE